MKQTIAVLAVTLAIVLAVSALIVSVNLRQAEIITEKTAQQTELLGKLNKLSLREQEAEEQLAALRAQTRSMTKERSELSIEMESSLKTIQAANDAILHLQQAMEQAEAVHQEEMDNLNQQLQDALLENETLTGERNGAVLQNGELQAREANAVKALEAANCEINSFAELLMMLNRLPQGQNQANRAAALQEALHTSIAFEQAYPASLLRLPDALVAGLRTEAERAAAPALPTDVREAAVP